MAKLFAKFCSTFLQRLDINKGAPLALQESLHDCGHDERNFCPGSGTLDVAAVVCVDEQADLEPDVYDLMSSAHLEDKQLFFLQVSASLVSHLVREHP